MALKTAKALDRRDRKLLHAIRVAAEEALNEMSFGHTFMLDELRKALDKADDEMGPYEDFEV